MTNSHSLHSLILITTGSVLLSACTSKSNEEAQTTDQGDHVRMLISSYGSAQDECIRLYDFDQSSGSARQLCGLSGVPDPSYLCLASDQGHFLAASETDDGNDALYLATIIEEGDSLTMQVLDSCPTEGKAPCYVNFGAPGTTAYTANYNGGNLTCFYIDTENWKIGEDPEVIQYEGSGPFLPNQQQSHIHCAQFSPDSSQLYVCDLGADRIHCINFIEETPLEDIELEAGSGPRHLIFSSDGRFAYVINELSGYVTVLDNQGTMLRPIQYALCDSVGGHGSADIHISNDGRFLYASNRLKADGISIFSIDTESGLISKIGYQLTGIHPRNFALSPNGKFLLCACRDSNCIQIFSRDEETGMLTDTKQIIEMNKVVCVKFL